MYSCEHDTVSIGNMHWPTFKRVVTNFSFALINATLLFWNDIDMSHYIDLNFEFVAGRNTFCQIFF